MKKCTIFSSSFSLSSTQIPKYLKFSVIKDSSCLERIRRICPVGTYQDKLTGWWAKCDCTVEQEDVLIDIPETVISDQICSDLVISKILFDLGKMNKSKKALCWIV